MKIYRIEFWYTHVSNSYNIQYLEALVIKRIMIYFLSCLISISGYVIQENIYKRIFYLIVKADFRSTWVTITPVETPRKISRCAHIHKFSNIRKI